MDNLGYVRIRQYILGQNNLQKLHDLEIRTHGPGLMHIAKLSTSIPLLQRSCCMMLLSCISTWCFYTVSTRYLGCMSPPGWCWTNLDVLHGSCSVSLSRRAWLWRCRPRQTACCQANAHIISESLLKFRLRPYTCYLTLFSRLLNWNSGRMN